MTSSENVIHLFIISDSIGETGQKVAEATMGQFPDVEILLHKFTFISNIDILQPILDSALDKSAIIYLTIADDKLAHIVETFCKDHQLTCYNLMQTMTEEITKRTGKIPSQRVGAQHTLDQEYFKRISAMEFVMRYDDGKDPRGFQEADIVLLGISRTSKTPLSMYLAILGYKVANLPLIPEIKIPDIVYQIDRSKIIGLTNSLKVVQKFRNNRMIEFGLPENSQYASSERIRRELEFSNLLYEELGCPVINVAERSIEETAHIIVNMLNL